MSQASSRVEKFYTDLSAVISQWLIAADDPDEKTCSRIKTNIVRLQKWIYKHQDESLPESAKLKLQNCILLCQKIGVKCNELRDTSFAIVDDYLKIPEGHLVSGKAKQTALKWLSMLSDSVLEDVAEAATWEVAEIDEIKKTICIIREDSVWEDISVPEIMLNQIIKSFEKEDGCAVQFDGTKVLSLSS
jgi:hypothetical protein